MGSGLSKKKRMQGAVEPILEQPIWVLKEVQHYLRQNIIMIGGKHEESYDGIIWIAGIFFWI